MQEAEGRENGSFSPFKRAPALSEGPAEFGAALKACSSDGEAGLPPAAPAVVGAHGIHGSAPGQAELGASITGWPDIGNSSAPTLQRTASPFAELAGALHCVPLSRQVAAACLSLDLGQHGRICCFQVLQLRHAATQRHLHPTTACRTWCLVATCIAYWPGPPQMHLALRHPCLVCCSAESSVDGTPGRGAAGSFQEPLCAFPQSQQAAAVHASAHSHPQSRCHRWRGQHRNRVWAAV